MFGGLEASRHKGNVFFFFFFWGRLLLFFNRSYIKKKNGLTILLMRSFSDFLMRAETSDDELTLCELENDGNLMMIGSSHKSSNQRRTLY